MAKTPVNKAARAMALAAKQAAVAGQLVGTSAQPVTYASMWAFINANGGMANVQVKPLANVARQPGVNPLPFGYNGKQGGVRATIQNWLVNGVALPGGGVSHTYQAIMGAAKGLGHSSQRPNCLLAVLNGGYSPSSPHWGTAFCALVATVAKAKSGNGKARKAKASATPAPQADDQPTADQPALADGSNTATG